MVDYLPGVFVLPLLSRVSRATSITKRMITITSSRVAIPPTTPPTRAALTGSGPDINKWYEMSTWLYCGHFLIIIILRETICYAYNDLDCNTIR